MPTVPSIAKLANISGANVNPVPGIRLPPLPEKLRRIDPDGSAQWLEDANKVLADFVLKQNTTQLGLNQAVLNLQRKP